MILVGNGKIEIKSDRQILKKAEERNRVYVCCACDARFRQFDAEYKSGYMVCPNCWHPDIEEIESAKECVPVK